MPVPKGDEADLHLQEHRGLYRVMGPGGRRLSTAYLNG